MLFSIFALPRLEYNLPFARSELHSDILPEVNVLVRHLKEFESRKNAGRDNSHFGPGEATEVLIMVPPAFFKVTIDLLDSDARVLAS